MYNDKYKGQLTTNDSEDEVKRVVDEGRYKDLPTMNDSENKASLTMNDSEYNDILNNSNDEFI